jgi:hypothetical protein
MQGHGAQPRPNLNQFTKTLCRPRLHFKTTIMNIRSCSALLAVGAMILGQIQAADVTFYSITKSQHWSQSAPGIVNQDMTFQIAARVLPNNGALGSVQTILPDGSVELLTTNSLYPYLTWSATYPSSGQGSVLGFDSCFPNGTYTFVMSTKHDGVLIVPLTLTGNDYPNAPQVSNYAALQSLDPTQEFTIQWLPFNGGETQDYIAVGIEASDPVFQTGLFGTPIALNGRATSVTIPANTLPAGAKCELILWFVKFVDINSTTYPGAVGYTGYGQTLVVPFTTKGMAPPIQSDYAYSTNNGSLTITGYEGAGGDVAIPEAISGLPVTGIGNYAFQYCTSVTSVTIPDSLSWIGYFAFDSCTNMTSVSIGNGVTSIGKCAFADCHRLASVMIGNGLTSLAGPGTFQYCYNLTSVTIGNSVTNIGNSAFYSCYSLTSFTIPTSVTSIAGAFGDCIGLTNVTIPNSVTNIGDWTFDGCSSLTSVTIPSSVSSIGDSTFALCRKLANVTIGNGVISIGDSAFSNCGNLTSVSIPNSVTNIGNDAFVGCSSLTSVSIGNGVISIGTNAFAYCTSLSSIQVDGLNLSYNSMDGVLFDKSQTTLVQYPGGLEGNYTIPNSVTNIGAAFSNCRLTSVTIGSGVTSIADSAFYYCTGLTSPKTSAL